MKKQFLLFVLLFILFGNKMSLNASQMPCSGISKFVMEQALTYCNNIEILEEEKEVIECAEEKEYILIDSTAYYNKYNRKCSDGTYPKANHTLAGMIEWRGRKVDLYDLEYNYIGEYTFNDVGYGKPTGIGKSRLLKGKSIGDIEAGKCIDIYMNTYNECMNYGRRDLYMVWK